MCFVYIIYSKTIRRFYIGETTDLKKRLTEHNEGIFDRSFTKTARDWELFHTIRCDSRITARKIERHIKRMKSKVYLENLKKYPNISVKLIDKYQT